MSRWSNFNVNEIQQQIGDIQIRLENLSSLDPSITAPMPDFIFEIARAREVLSFIYDYLKTIKPHLLRSGYSSQDIINQLNNISTSISQFQVDKNFGYITNINAYIDNILSYLSQNTFPTIQKTKATTPLTSIIQSYEQNIKDSLNRLDFVETQKQIDKINEAYEKILIEPQNALMFQIQSANTASQEVLKKIIHNQEQSQESLIKIEENLMNATQYKQSIDKEYNLICVDNEKGNSYATKIKNIKTESEKTHQNIETLKNEFQDYINNGKRQIDEYIAKIENTFKIAYSTALSDKFYSEAKKQQEEIKNWNLWFKIAIACIFLGTFLSFSILDKDKIFDISAFFIRLAFVAPFIWFGFYASSRRSEAQRLEQEYTHKATALGTYLLHKNEIKEFGNDDELINKLINSNIDTVAFNPSSSLDKVNKDKDYKNLIKDTKEIIKDTKEIIQEFQAPNTQNQKSGNQQ